jgi:hypothetical protein
MLGVLTSMASFQHTAFTSWKLRDTGSWFPVLDIAISNHRQIGTAQNFSYHQNGARSYKP